MSYTQGNNSEYNHKNKYASLNNIIIVLVEPSHPGNIGSVARAMKNMGLSRLTLVNPKQFPSLEASTRASSAADILHNAKIVNSLSEAIIDTKLVFGTSSRLRKVEWPQKTVRETAEIIRLTTKNNNEISLVFGRESSGLSNEEMDKCDYLSYIPTNQDYSSLNIAQSVQVFSYECRIAIDLNTKETTIKPTINDMKATSEEMEGFYKHLQQTLQDIDFLDPMKNTRFMRRMRKLFNRTKLEHKEVNILRGVLTSAQKKSKQHKQEI